MIRLGVIGYGRRFGYLIPESFRAAEPDLRVVGVVDPDEEGVRARLAESDRKDVVFYKTLDEMARSANPDAVAIGTRCNLHTDYAVQAAKYDLPLFLEKPVSISMEQAVKLEAAFDNSRCRVLVSFPLRVSPLCELAHKLIAEEGAVGRPDHIAAVNYVPYGTCYWEQGYRYFDITGGLFLQKATHDFDYMSRLMGSSIVRVAAMANYGRIFGGKRRSGLVCSECDEGDTCPESPENRKRHGTTGTKRDHPCLFSVDCGTPETGTNEECASAVVEFASGAHGVYTQVFFTRRDAATRGATVSGYHGTVSFDWYKNELRRVRHHAPFSDTVKGGEGVSHFGGDLELARNFIDMIRRNEEPRAGIRDGIQSVYACLAARESAETGRFVEVRQVGAR